MAKRPILGLFKDANAAADAGDALKSSGVSDRDIDFLTDAPYCAYLRSAPRNVLIARLLTSIASSSPSVAASKAIRF